MSVSFFSLMLVGSNVTKLSASTSRSLQASFLLEEGLEAVRSVRDRVGFNALMLMIAPIPPTPPGTGYLWFSTSTSQWRIDSATPEVINDIFFRTIVLSPVSRSIVPGSTMDDIVTSGGTNDINTKKLTVYVSWRTGPATTTISASTYLTNYFDD